MCSLMLAPSQTQSEQYLYNLVQIIINDIIINL